MLLILVLLSILVVVTHYTLQNNLNFKSITLAKVNISYVAGLSCFFGEI